MKRESLDGLKAAFEEWRSRKRYRQQATPAVLLARARRAAQRHGSAAVVRATKVEKGRLNAEGSSRPRLGRSVAVRAPAFSRLALAAPAVAAQPFAEVETATGLKLRFFTRCGEALGLLSSLCRAGGGQ